MWCPQDLLFINDGNDKMVEGTDLYNFDKMRMIAKIITTLNEYVDGNRSFRNVVSSVFHFDLSDFVM